MRQEQHIELIFKENYKELCFLAHNYLADLDEAQDVVQDVFVKLLTTQNKPITNYNAYLKTAVRNSCLKRLRDSKLVLLQDIDSRFETDKYEFEQEEIKREEAQLKLYRAIEHLPPQCKKIFVLCVVEGMTYPKAAETLEVSANTIKTHIKRAYKMLRVSLSESQISYVLAFLGIFF